MEKEKIKINKSELELKDFDSISGEILDFFSKLNYLAVDSFEILEFLENSPELKDKKFLKISYLSNKISFETINNSGKKEKLIFNLETKKFEKELEKNISETPKLLETSSLLLGAMEEIFSANKTGEFFGELEEKDVLKTDIFNKNGLNLKGKNLRDLQIIYRENQKKLDEIQSTFDEKQLKEFNKQQKKYLEFVAGIGDKYEGGASFLLETKKNYTKIIDNIIKNSSITEIFLYMSELHQKIDSNNWQSTSVKKSYEMTMKLFSEGTFERLKKENSPDEYFVNFSKILTGRGNYKDGKFDSKDIDDELRNPKLAAQALNFVFTRENGMFDKMNLKNIDPGLKNKKVSDISTELEKEMKLQTGQDFSADVFYESIDYKNLIRDKDLKYEELSFDSQTKLGVMNRFLNSLRARRSIGKKLSSDPNSKDNILNIFKQIGKTYLKFATKNIEELFSSNNIFSKSFWSAKSAKDFGLDGIQKEAYELFVNMNGLGLATFSDNSVSIGKEVGKFGAIIAVSIGAAIMTGGTSLIAQGAAAGAAGSIASWGIYPKGYDAKKEATVDLASDVALGVGTGALGGKLTQIAIGKWGTEVLDDAGNVIMKNGKAVKTLGLKKEAIVTGVDVAVLGIGPEFLRAGIVDKIFHNQDLIIDSSDDNLQKVYERKGIKINNSTTELDAKKILQKAA